MDETAAALPDDMVLEVLARVDDVASLFRCALACMRWRGLVTDHSFLRRRWPENATHPSFLVGFFTQRRRYPRSEDDDEYPITQDDVDPDSPPVFIPAPRSVLASGFRLSSAGLLHGAMTLCARRGLLLVRLGPIVSSGPLRLAVCDFLAGRCHVIPPLEYDGKSVPTSYAILTGEDCRSSDGQWPRSAAPDYSMFFKVVAVVVRHFDCGDLEYNVHVSSSDKPGWASPSKLTASGFWQDLQHDAVCRRGMVHWLSSNWFLGYNDPSSIITLDSSSEDCQASLAELSLPAMIRVTTGTYHMATLDGTLCLFCLRTEQEDLRLEITSNILKDRGTDLHLASRVIELKPPENKHLHEPSCRWSGEKSGTLLIMDWIPCTDLGLRLCTYVAYLQTGQVEEVSSQLSDMVGNMVPIEIDWPELFMSRLVGG